MKAKFLIQAAVAATLVLAMLIGCAIGSPNRTFSSTSTSSDATPVGEAWVELGPDGAVLARTLVPGPNCPVLETNRGPIPMVARTIPSPDFPTTCEAALPQGIDSAALNGRHLALPAPRLHRIVVIGDTGCRLKITPGLPPLIQDCQNAWPFAKVAATAASLHPDLVIHVGDYHYRESPCPDGNVSCAGSITGDVWGSWYQDFFHPVGELLGAAPWIFVRGNHESCSPRAGLGYFRLLDPRPVPPGPSYCQDQTSPYVVRTAGHQFVVLDSSPADVTAAMLAPLATLTEKLNGHAWLLSHRPLWIPVGSSTLPGALARERAHPAIVPEDREDPDEEASERSTIPAPVPAIGVPTGVDLALSGHRHVFESMTFSDGRPPLIIGGDSGTALDTDIPTGNLTGNVVDTTTLASWLALTNFGFIELEALESSRSRETWQLIVHDPAGGVLKSCLLTPPKHAHRRHRRRGGKVTAPEGMQLSC